MVREILNINKNAYQEIKTLVKKEKDRRDRRV